MATKDVEFAGKTYTGEELTDEEQNTLFKHVIDYLAAEDAFLQRLFQLNKNSVLAAAMGAKHKLGAPFNGILAADPQIGVSLIRPGHILRTTGGTETPLNSWDSQGVQAGAFVSGIDNWIGYGSNNGTAINIDKEALITPMGLAFRQGQKPFVQEVRFQIGETVYPVVVADQAAMADNPNRVRAVRLHPLLMEPKQTVFAETWSETGGRNEMKLLGLTFGLGRFLRNRNYTAVST